MQVGSMTSPSEHGNEPSGSMKGTTTINCRWHSAYN